MSLTDMLNQVFGGRATVVNTSDTHYGKKITDEDSNVTVEIVEMSEEEVDKQLDIDEAKLTSVLDIISAKLQQAKQGIKEVRESIENATDELQLQPVNCKYIVVKRAKDMSNRYISETTPFETKQEAEQWIETLRKANPQLYANFNYCVERV